MKQMSFLQKTISRFSPRNSHFICKTFTSTPYYYPSINTEPSITSFSTNPCISLLGICTNLSSLKLMHALLIVHGETKDTLLKTKLISLYGSFGRIKYARFVFDEIPDPDFNSCKVMIRWYFLHDLYNDVIEFYKYIRKRINVVDNVVFSIVLKACKELLDLDEGEKLHCHIIKVGGPDNFVLIGLVDMYAKCGEIKYSKEVFDEIMEKDVVCWTSMIVNYVQNNCPTEGLVLFNKMRGSLVKGNEYTLGSVVIACTKLYALHQGKWIHGYIIKNILNPNCHLITSLVDMYVKCGVIIDARLIFDEFRVIDLITYTAMIVGYTQCNYPNEALRLFLDMKYQNVGPNSVTISSLISACSQLCDLKMGKSLHSLVIKLGLYDVTVSNALIDMYGKCGKIKDSRYLFESLNKKDVISWNSLISVFSSQGFAHEAFKLFRKMSIEKNVKPDSVTIVSILSACGLVNELKLGLLIHGYSIKRGFISSNIYIGTSLLYLYAKCGDVKSSRIVFDEMRDKNLATWSAMIGGYGMQGDFNNSVALFGYMKKERLEFNDEIFTSILSTCSYTGMIEEGWGFFNMMSSEYNIVPSLKHYVCIVDMLARGGRLEEAWVFIEKMESNKVDVSLFVAFLNGCSMYSRFDLADVAIRKMKEMGVNDSCYYVFLSNFYGYEKRWSEAYEVREIMQMKGLKKFPGSSHV